MDATHAPAYRPDDVIFLDRKGVRITRRWFDTTTEKFEVRELTRVWTMNGPLDAVALTAVKATGVVVVIGGISAPFLDPAGWLGVGVVLLLTIGVALLALRLRPRRQELWACYDGTEVQIFGSADPVWFNQVCRALQRARQVNGGGVA